MAGDRIEQVTPELFVRKRAREEESGEESEWGEGQSKKKHAKMKNKIDHLLKEIRPEIDCRKQG